MARMTKAKTRKRYAGEDVLASLMILDMSIDELLFRIDQALQRPEKISPVLVPAIERLGEMRAAINQANEASRALIAE